MIKLENLDVYGWEAAIRGMRNPMNSWDKMDSWQSDFTDDGNRGFIIGKNDLQRMKTLVKGGSDHSKFMRMINVTVDIVAPLYWWKEFDTYKIGTVANSCSTMHKIADKEFALDDFSCEHLLPETMREFERIIVYLNAIRRAYVEGGRKNKKMWWQMIQLLPSSYNQRRTVQLNYAVLRNMYHSRKSHKLDEWLVFCEWIKSLPYSELITMEGN